MTEVFHNVKTETCPEADGQDYQAVVSEFDRHFKGIRVLKDLTPETRLTHGTREEWQRAARMSRQLWGSFPLDKPDEQYITDPERRPV